MARPSGKCLAFWILTCLLYITSARSLHILELGVRQIANQASGSSTAECPSLQDRTATSANDGSVTTTVIIDGTPRILVGTRIATLSSITVPTAALVVLTDTISFSTTLITATAEIEPGGLVYQSSPGLGNPIALPSTTTTIVTISSLPTILVGAVNVALNNSLPVQSLVTLVEVTCSSTVVVTTSAQIQPGGIIYQADGGHGTPITFLGQTSYLSSQTTSTLSSSTQATFLRTSSAQSNFSQRFGQSYASPSFSSSGTAPEKSSGSATLSSTAFKSTKTFTASLFTIKSSKEMSSDHTSHSNTVSSGDPTPSNSQTGQIVTSNPKSSKNSVLSSSVFTHSSMITAVVSGSGRSSVTSALSSVTSALSSITSADASSTALTVDSDGTSMLLIESYMSGCQNSQTTWTSTSTELTSTDTAGVTSPTSVGNLLEVGCWMFWLRKVSLDPQNKDWGIVIPITTLNLPKVKYPSSSRACKWGLLCYILSIGTTPAVAPTFTIPPPPEYNPEDLPPYQQVDPNNPGDPDNKKSVSRPKDPPKTQEDDKKTTNTKGYEQKTTQDSKPRTTKTHLKTSVQGSKLPTTQSSKPTTGRKSTATAPYSSRVSTEKLSSSTLISPHPSTTKASSILSSSGSMPPIFMEVTMVGDRMPADFESQTGAATFQTATPAEYVFLGTTYAPASQTLSPHRSTLSTGARSRTSTQMTSSSLSSGGSMPPIVREVTMVGDRMPADFTPQTGAATFQTATPAEYVFLGTTYAPATLTPSAPSRSGPASSRTKAPTHAAALDAPPMVTANVLVSKKLECVEGDCSENDEIFLESDGTWPDFCTTTALGLNAQHGEPSNGGVNAIYFSLQGEEPIECSYTGGQDSTHYGLMICSGAATVQCVKPPASIKSRSICFPPGDPTTTSSEVDSFALCVVAYRVSSKR